MKKFIFILWGLIPLKISQEFVPPVIETVHLSEITIKMDTPKYLRDFLHDIGKRESGNRYDLTNSLGYLGRYQFGMTTLTGLKIETTPDEFLNNPRLQETAMRRLLRTNKRKLKVVIQEYEGHIIDSVLITESGILAAAHLGGAGSVMKYFRNGKIKHDSYGTSITNYLKKFSGYNLNIN